MSEFNDDQQMLKCNTCRAAFLSVEKVKDHYRSDWHVLNSKRRASGLLPLRKDDFKLLKSTTGFSANSVAGKQSVSPSKTVSKSEEVPKNKKTESKIPEEDTTNENVNEGDADDNASEVSWETEVTEQQPQPAKLGSHICIFDDKDCGTMDECLQYMSVQYGFFIPDIEYMVDLEGFLTYLGEKVKLGGYCLYCQKQLRPGRATQNHMISKSHCKIAYEEGIDMEEFEDFYDFTSSYNEDVELDEDGNDIETTEMEITPIGELVLPTGKTVGHRDFRRYYRQRYRQEDTREPILALQKEELVRLGYKFGGLQTNLEDIEKMSNTEVMTMLVKYHKEVRKGQMIEQRMKVKQESRFQKNEYKSNINKLRSTETTTAKIRDYHRMLC